MVSQAVVHAANTLDVDADGGIGYCHSNTRLAMAQIEMDVRKLLQSGFTMRTYEEVGLERDAILLTQAIT